MRSVLKMPEVCYSSHRVLVADAPHERRHLCSVLQKQGYQTVEADQGQQVIDLLRCDRFGVALIESELVLDDQLGCHILQTARMEQVPIIMLTDSNALPSIFSSEFYGFISCLNKPVEPAELLGAVHLAEENSHWFNKCDRIPSEAEILDELRMQTFLQLVGGIAHDLNNLLTVISSCCALLMDENRSQESSRGYLADINHASERANCLLKELAAYCRNQAPEPRIVDLNEIVTNDLHLLRRLVGKGIEICTELDTVPCWVNMNPNQLEQILLNLVVNARDAMPNGGQLTISTSQVHMRGGQGDCTVIRDADYAVLSVIDTGNGMDYQTQRRIFDPFFTTKKDKGTGVGLTTVQRIVEQASGYIKVSSTPGAGAVFAIYLPLMKHDLRFIYTESAPENLA